MASYTFTKAGREFRVDGPQQLCELVRDRLLTLDDELQPDDASAPVRVGDLIGKRDAPPPGRAGGDPWDAWDDDGDDDGATDLVEQMLSGQRPGVGASPKPPAAEPPRPGRYLLVGGGSRREDLSSEATPARAEPPGEPRTPALAVAPPEELPASFVEFVQQKRAVVSPLEIHDDAGDAVFHGEEPDRHLPWLVPVLAGVFAMLGAAAVYGVVRVGAQRTYPTEAEVRGGARDQAADRTPADITPEPGTPTPLSPEIREIRIRESIPAAVRPFRDVESLQDVLFTDLTNTGVRVRAVRIAPLVLKPDAGGIPTRPEEVHLEVDIASEDGPAMDDDLLRAAMILGHYGAVAHLRIQDVLLRLDIGAEDPLCFRTRGPQIVALYEREVPLVGFVAGLETVLPGFTVVPTEEESEEDPPQ